MEQPSSIPAPAGPKPSREEFHEEAYLQLYPDIARGVAAGRIESGWRHFDQHGFTEGRKWLVRPNPFLGVGREIAPQDEMFSGNAAHYFDVGESALHCIETALHAARREKSGIRRILDLPCGHGRVLRFLRKAFPDAELTACDLNEDGVAFCARVFGAIGVISHVEAGQIPLHGEFDLIWCGSLLTHLPEKEWAPFLRLFQRRLGHRGILVFTTHGRHIGRDLNSTSKPHGITAQQIADLLRDFHARGFAYVDYPGHSGYGFSLAHPAFVMANVIEQAEWRLLGYHENGWDKLQDAICLQKADPVTPA